MRRHLLLRAPLQLGESRLFDSLTLLALTGTAFTMLGVFAIVPNISAFLQHNLGYPREGLGFLYLVGGLASFVVVRLVGRLVDRFGATRLVALGTGLFCITLFFGFIRADPDTPVVLVFTLFMLSGSVRAVPLNTLATRVPRPDHRARFMSAQSATQHLASAAGALFSSWALSADASGRLHGMDRVATAALFISLLVPVFAFAIERRVKRREREFARAH